MSKFANENFANSSAVDFSVSIVIFLLYVYLSIQKVFIVLNYHLIIIYTTIKPKNQIVETLT